MLARFSRSLVAICFFLSSFVSVSPVSAASCQFVLGFKAIHDLIPTTVGDCLVDEHHNPTNGDGENSAPPRVVDPAVRPDPSATNRTKRWPL